MKSAEASVMTTTHFARRFVLPLVALCACGSGDESGPEGYAANKSKLWATSGLGKGELVAYAGNREVASSKTPDGAINSGSVIGTISEEGAIKISLPPKFDYSNNSLGLRTYCNSGFDFEFHTGYSCYSRGQDEEHTQRNSCTYAIESQVQNIRLAAKPAKGDARSVTTLAELVDSDAYPHAIVVLDHPTKIDGCSNCFFFDETIGLTTDKYTRICYTSATLPANTLLGVFRKKGPHVASETLDVNIRPLVASDLKFLAVSGAP
jgi:hypothetical protein